MEPNWDDDKPTEETTRGTRYRPRRDGLASPSGGARVDLLVGVGRLGG